MNELELQTALANGLITEEEYYQKSPCTSRWLKSALAAIETRDLVDMAADIEVLAKIVNEKVSAMYRTETIRKRMQL